MKVSNHAVFELHCDVRDAFRLHPFHLTGELPEAVTRTAALSSNTSAVKNREGPDPKARSHPTEINPVEPDGVAVNRSLPDLRTR